MEGVIATGAVFLALARGSLAHDHHTDNIPEGEGISPDPLVSLLPLPDLELKYHSANS